MTTNGPTVLAVHPDAELSGLGRALLESVTGLREARCRVVVALPEEGPLVAKLHLAGAEVQIVPMVVLRPASPSAPRWSALLRRTPAGFIAAWRTLSRVRPDTVYVSTEMIPQWPITARLRRIPTVSHLRAPQASASRIVGRLLHRPHLASQHTLVDSRTTLHALHRTLPALAQRAEVVYDALPSPQSPTPPREPLEGPLRVLYIGNLCPKRGADLAIEAAAQLRRGGQRVTVTLVGTSCASEEWFEEQLREQAADAEFEIEFAGDALDHRPFFAQTDVVLVPPRTEDAYELAAVDAVLSLRPVVASDTEGLCEAVGEKRTVRLVRPDDAQEIARELTDLVEEWSEIVGALPASRAQTLQRHDPATYHEAIALACGAEPRVR